MVYKVGKKIDNDMTANVSVVILNVTLQLLIIYRYRSVIHFLLLLPKDTISNFAIERLYPLFYNKVLVYIFSQKKKKKKTHSYSL